MTVVPRRRRRVLRLLGRCLAFLVLLWVAVVVVFKFLENRLIYAGANGRTAWIEQPDEQIEEVWLTSADGTRLGARFLPSKASDGAILISHGNGGNVSRYGEFLHYLRKQLGRSVLVYDYPGYGQSEGQPNEAGCYTAGEAGYRFLTETRGVPANRVVLFGESLGCGVSIEMATRHDHASLVLLYPFTSLPAAAKWHYPILPCHTLMSNRYDNLAKIGRCHRPLFIIHGTADPIVPFAQGERLFQAANEPKRLLAIEGGSHDPDFGEAVYAELRRFLDEPR